MARHPKYLLSNSARSGHLSSCRFHQCRGLKSASLNNCSSRMRSELFVAHLLVALLVFIFSFWGIFSGFVLTIWQEFSEELADLARSLFLFGLRPKLLKQAPRAAGTVNHNRRCSGCTAQDLWNVQHWQSQSQSESEPAILTPGQQHVGRVTELGTCYFSNMVTWIKNEKDKP